MNLFSALRKCWHRHQSSDLVRRRWQSSLSHEPLEERVLLAADPLATFTGSVLTLSGTAKHQLVIQNDGTPATLAIHVEATAGSSLNPAAVEIRDAAGSVVAPVSALADQTAAGDSLVVTTLPAGTYELIVSGQDGTSGGFILEVCLPGDSSGDGGVDGSEIALVQAALIQNLFSFNLVAPMVFDSLGVDVGVDLYDVSIDANMDGTIDAVDAAIIEMNVGTSNVQVGITVVDETPVITGSVTPDSRFPDGITNVPTATISGNARGTSDLVEFRGSIDGGGMGPSFDLLPDRDAATGDFEISRTRLEQIFGAPLLDTGVHTLFLTATDSFGNATTAPVAIPFAYDTVVPGAATDIELDPASDSGTLNDLKTNDTTPTIIVDAEVGSTVTLFSDRVNGGATSIGEGVASSPVAITTSTLPEGANVITATVTDVAGNVSDPTTVTVIIDTIAPQIAGLDLDPPSTETDGDGNPLTSDTTVSIAGATNEAATIVLTGGVTQSVASNPDGSFSFTVVLPFGQTILTATATDVAGNSSALVKTFTRDTVPQLDTSLGTLDLDEDDPDATIDLTAFFSDPNIGEGDTLTFSVSGGNAALVTASVSGSNITFDPQADANGSTQFTIRATDLLGLFVEDTITVNVAAQNDAPVANAPGTVTVATATESAIAGVSITDVDAGISDIEVSITATSGTVSVSPTAGLTFSVGTGTGNAMMTFRGSLSTVNTALANLKYTSIAAFTGPASVTIDVDDLGNTGAGGSQTGQRFVSVTVVPISEANTAPILDNSGSPTLTEITEDEITNTGNSVSGLIGGSISDPNPGALQGIAVTGTAIVGGGTWQSSTNGGVSWQDIGSVADSQALLLRPTDRLRLVPDGENGATASVTFRAWDQTTGIVGSKVDTGGGGGMSAFSTASETANLNVTDVNDNPSFVVVDEAGSTITAVTVPEGNSKYVALNGTDVDGNALTYTVTGGAPGVVSASITSGNRSVRFTIAPNADLPDGGEMIFQLFEQQVGLVTQQFINLVEQGAFNGNEFGRVVANFVIQAGDLSGTAFTAPQLDDQITTQTVHLGAGYLSLANQGDATLSNGDIVSGDDTNSASYFITLVATRFLDGNHSVYGFQVVGHAVRDAIGSVPVSGETPVTPVVQETVEIFVDPVNGVLVLTALPGASGTAQVTVTADDGNGGTSQRVIDVTVVADTANMAPFLNAIAPVSTAQDTNAVISVSATDAEGNSFSIDAKRRSTVNFDDAGSENGVTQLGTSGFSHKGSTWSGGTVISAETASGFLETALGGFDKAVYLVDSGTAEVVFDNPVDGEITFYFVHGLGVAPGLATAFDEAGNILGTVSSNPVSTFADPGNFETLNFPAAIKRITFPIDAFDYTPYSFTVTPPGPGGAVVVTVTPPAGFTGELEILIRVKPVGPTDTASTIDTQIVRITVNSALQADLTQASYVADTVENTVANTVAPVTITIVEDEQIKTVLASAVEAWRAGGLTRDVDIELEVADLGNAALASAAVLERDDAGHATRAIVTIDTDAAGLGWYIDVSAPPADAGFDLYSVLVHELGHVIGFSDVLSHSHGNASAALAAIGVDAVWTPDGHHLDADHHPGDAMNPLLVPGQRRPLTDLDILILQALEVQAHDEMFDDFSSEDHAWPNS